MSGGRRGPPQHTGRNASAHPRVEGLQDRPDQTIELACHAHPISGVPSFPYLVTGASWVAAQCNARPPAIYLIADLCLWVRPAEEYWPLLHRRKSPLLPHPLTGRPVTQHPRPARFGFLKLVVRDLQKQTAFYRAVFGCGEGQRITGDIAGRPIEEIVLFRPDGQAEIVILVYKDGQGPAPQTSGVIAGIFTPDIEAFEASVLAAGGTIAQPIGPLELPNGMSRLAFYADPEGYLLEVIEA